MLIELYSGLNRLFLKKDKKENSSSWIFYVRKKSKKSNIIEVPDSDRIDMPDLFLNRINQSLRLKLIQSIRYILKSMSNYLFMKKILLNQEKKEWRENVNMKMNGMK